MVMAKWSETGPRGYVLTMLCSTKNGAIHFAVDGGDSVLYESENKPTVTPPSVQGGTVSIEAWTTKVRLSTMCRRRLCGPARACVLVHLNAEAPPAMANPSFLSLHNGSPTDVLK